MSYDSRNVETVKLLSIHNSMGLYTELNTSEYSNPYNNKIHFHSYYELEFILSGAGLYEINNTSFNIEKGALFLTTPADYHSYSITRDQSIRMYILQFFPENLSDTVNSALYTQTEPIALYFHEAEYENILARIAHIHQIFTNPKPMYEIMLRNEFENLCIALLHILNHGKSALDEHSVVKKVIIYVKNNYRHHLTLEGIAEYVGLSKSYLSRIFSAATGTSLSTYIRRVRLDAAANLLKSTELSVKEISYQTGFRNTNYFTDAFCEQFGTPPRQYRKNYRESIGM